MGESLKIWDFALDWILLCSEGSSMNGYVNKSYLEEKKIKSFSSNGWKSNSPLYHNGEWGVWYFMVSTVLMFSLCSGMIAQQFYFCLDPSCSWSCHVWCWCSLNQFIFNRGTLRHDCEHQISLQKHQVLAADQGLEFPFSVKMCSDFSLLFVVPWSCLF